MKHRDDNRGFDGVLREGLSAGAPHSENCPGPDFLAAYFERSLAPGEIQHFDAHLSTCPRCRAQLAAMVRAEPAQGKDSAESFSLFARRPWFAPAVAALAIVLIAVGIREYQRIKTEPQIVAQTQPAALPAALPPVSTEQKNAELSTEQTKVQRIAPPAAAKQRAVVPHNAGGTSTAGRSFDSFARLTPAAPAPKPAPPAGIQIESQAASSELPATPSSATETVVSGQAGGVAGGAVGNAPATTDTMSGRKVERMNKTAPSNAAGPAARSGASAVGALAKPAARAEIEVPPSSEAVEVESEPLVIPTPDYSKSWRIAGGGIEFSGDSGKTWKIQMIVPAGSLIAGSAPSPNTCWLVGRSGQILRTTDGETWKPVAAPTTQDLTSVTASSGKKATITAADGTVANTRDGGKTWIAKGSKP